ncbi:MAG: hypothetical protein F9K16_12605 [Thermoanaerobaculia bacterium]|nr:MAG: hypothetical protein F9K16_12605 [Thermoanaerobaculia bacterium]MBZ0102833.1 hypothetical protein [Thermoanaerobaculia bacterium]
MSDALLAVMGAGLAIVSGIITSAAIDEFGRRRRALHASKLLVFHLGRFEDKYSLSSSSAYNAELDGLAREYLRAVLELRSSAFEPHQPILASLFESLSDSSGSEQRRRVTWSLERALVLIGGVRRDLARIIEQREPGFMARNGIVDESSPIREVPDEPGAEPSPSTKDDE